MASIHDVADYFLQEVGPLRHLKLQKLCYYAQGFYVGIFERPLFEEPFFAWQYGPASPALAQRFRGHRSSLIPVPDRAASLNEIFSAEQREYLDLVVARIGEYHDWDLVGITHSEDPWRDARRAKADGGSGQITFVSLHRWFAPRIHELTVSEAPGPPTPEQIEQAMRDFRTRFP